MKQSQAVMRDMSAYLREDEIKRLMSVTDSIAAKLMFTILLKSGRRVGEVLMLKVRDIDFNEKKVIWHIEKKNPGKYRKQSEETDAEFRTRKAENRKKKRPYLVMKPMDGFSLKLLQDWITLNQLESADYIFFSNDKRSKIGIISRQTIFRWCNFYGKKAGIIIGKKGLHPHHFRHTFAIRTIKKLKTPSEIKKLMDWLEHSSLDITQFYLQFRDDDTRELLDEEEY